MARHGLSQPRSRGRLAVFVNPGHRRSMALLVPSFSSTGPAHADPGLMYDDSRAANESRIANEAGAATWASLGYRMQPSWALPKLLWLLREHGGLPAHARLAHQADFITSRLAGHDVGSDSSNSLKTGYDLIRETWPRDVLQTLEVPEHIMPVVVRPGTQIGEVCREAAILTGIPAGTAIIAGMTDGCAAQIAAGALELVVGILC